jgi:hypothetical protein
MKGGKFLQSLNRTISSSCGSDEYEEYEEENDPEYIYVEEEEEFMAKKQKPVVEKLPEANIS